jgi:hypothetical protein
MPTTRNDPSMDKVVEFPPERIKRIEVNSPWSEADADHSREECGDPTVCIFHRFAVSASEQS